MHYIEYFYKFNKYFRLLIFLFTILNSNYIKCGPSYATSIALDLDNKLVVAANLYDAIRNISALAVIKYNQDGSVDTSFNATGSQPGVFILELYSGVNPINITINGITVDSNNKIVVTGIANFKFSNPVLSDFLIVVRINPDGTLDRSFASLSQQPGLVIYAAQSFNIGGNAVKIDYENKIVVTGFYNNAFLSEILVVKINQDGTLDNSFALSGAIAVSVYNNKENENDVGTALTFDNNNNIIVGGTTTTQQAVLSQESVSAPITNFVILSIDPAGFLNPNFGTFSLQNGITVTNITGMDYLTSIALDSKNRIVAAGYTNIATNQLAPNDYNPVSNTEFAIVRYLYNGQLDTTFGTSKNALSQNYIKNIPGVVVTNLNGDTDNIYGLAIDNNNKIVVTGQGNIGATTQVTSTNNIANSNIPASLAGQPDATVASTNLQLQTPSVEAFTSARYNQDGSLDTTFNPSGANSKRAGVVVTSVLNNTYPSTIISSQAAAILIDNNNKIVTAGRSNNGIFNDVTLIRYNNDGSFDTSFNGNFTSTTPGVVITSIELGNNPYGPENQNFDKVNKMIGDKELEYFVPKLESLEAYKLRNNIDVSNNKNSSLNLKQNIKEIGLKKDGLDNLDNQIKNDSINFKNSRNNIDINISLKDSKYNIFKDEKRGLIFTNSPILLLKGDAFPESNIEIKLNNIIKNLKVGLDGLWHSDINLDQSSNNLEIHNDKVLNSKKFRIIFNNKIDYEPIIVNPVDGSIENNLVMFNGFAQPYSLIDLYINGNIIDSTYANEKGQWYFNKDYGFKDGEQLKVYIISKDLSTNQTIQSKESIFSISLKNDKGIKTISNNVLDIKITKSKNREYVQYYGNKNQNIKLYINGKKILDKIYKDNLIKEKFEIGKYKDKNNVNKLKILIKNPDSKSVQIEKNI